MTWHQLLFDPFDNDIPKHMDFSDMSVAAELRDDDLRRMSNLIAYSGSIDSGQIILLRQQAIDKPYLVILTKVPERSGK